ncbi:MAG: hypothetical protein RLZZ210_213 [Pseudomonadota bacterium]|jgi:predicted transposase/invertase (TIGR01784 family)
MSKEIFINPFTDFGFKKLFGEESSKPQLISFLNSILPQHHQVTSLEYTKNEYQGLTEFDRKAILDISCKTPSGETIIIELQKAKQNYFKDRSLYYSSFPIIQQAQKGEWNYKLNAVYTIAILDFTFSEDNDSNTVVHTVQLKDQNNKLFYDKLMFVYLTLPNFNKTEKELVSNQDKWFYLFKNLAYCDDIPDIYKKDKLFEDIFEKAKLAKFNQLEHSIYINSLKEYLDLFNTFRTATSEAEAKGIMQGRAEGRIEGELQAKLVIAKNLKNLNLPLENIMQVTGLTKEQIETIF